MATIAESRLGQDMSYGPVIDLAFATIRHNPGVTLGLALLVGAIPGLLVTFASSQVPADAMNAGSAAFWTITAASIIGGMVVSALTQAFLTRATVAQSEGRKASLGESARAGLIVIIPLIGLALLTSVGITLGLVLLIVPGVMLMVAWSVATPVLVEERQGIIESIQRSNDLTRGSRSKIFLLLVVVGILAALATGAVEMMVGLDDSDPLASFGNPAYLLLSTLVGTVVSLISGTIQSAIYVELRDCKEGPRTAHLEQVFS